MVLGFLILILSTALLLFYFQILCQSILRREFERPYFRAIVNASRLEFYRLREAFEQDHPQVDYAGLRQSLKCDLEALTYLLKNAANLRLRYSLEERLLLFYFRLMFLSLALRHSLALREKPAVLKLTVILQYFANLVGQQVNAVGATRLEYIPVEPS